MSARSVHALAERLPARLRQFLRGYPWDAVLLATMLVILIVLLGSFAQDAIWNAAWSQHNRPAALEFRGTCYWMADARLLIRIAGNGYSDYDVNLLYRHLTVLPDRSWWPVFINLTARVLWWTGGNYCSAWLVNLVAMACLPVAIQAVTKTRRPLLLAGVALLPFGTWLYAGITEGTFLLFSAILLWMARHAPSRSRPVNLGWGLAALLWGIVLGLTKPNSLALLPGFGVLALMRTYSHLQAAAAQEDRPFRLWSRASLRHALDDVNPGWAALLGMLGMLIGLGAWFYQTSGYYPLYVLMAQRTLWYKEFDGGSLLALFSYLTGGLQVFLRGGGLPHPYPWNMMTLATTLLAAILVVKDFPPRWKNTLSGHRTPLYAIVSIITVYWLMFNTGQAHSIERYYTGNIFFVLAYLRYVYGDEDEPRLHHLPGLIQRREDGTLRAILRLVMLGCGLALLVEEAFIMAFYGI